MRAGAEYFLTPGEPAQRRYEALRCYFVNDAMLGLALAERVPVGMVHSNDQTSTDEPIAPFGGVGTSGNGARIGGQEANRQAFTEMQWVTINTEPCGYPF